MESRKAWRNREPSAVEGVLALLEALRDGLGSGGVGLFDDDRSAAGEPSPPNFWDAFDERPCSEIDWDSWYRDLRASGHVETACGCDGDHRLHGFLIHGRWALLLVAPAVLPPGGAAAIASSIRALTAKLPPARDAEATAAERAPATAAGPLLWWVRKGPH